MAGRDKTTNVFNICLKFVDAELNNMIFTVRILLYQYCNTGNSGQALFTLSVLILCRWLVLAMAMIRFYIQKGTHKGLYRSIARTLKFFQTFALVEVRIGVE